MMEASDPARPGRGGASDAMRKDECDDDEVDKEASEPRPLERMPGRRARGGGRKMDDDDDNSVQDNDGDARR